ncbi:unnamed protein product [Effrenium voratum]|nr:unnamed protein product [Effrenium voratum]
MAMEILLRQFAWHLLQEAHSFHSQRLSAPLATEPRRFASYPARSPEWLASHDLLEERSELVKLLRKLQERMREAEAKLEASEDVVEEVAAIATSLAFAQAIAAPKAVSRLCFSVEQTLAELQSRCQAKRQADQADGSLKASDFLQLSWEQKDAVEYPHSLFLQGRSGTGKTLVLVQRILLRRGRRRLPPSSSSQSLISCGTPWYSNCGQLESQ